MKTDAFRFVLYLVLMDIPFGHLLSAGTLQVFFHTLFFTVDNELMNIVYDKFFRKHIK